MFINNECVKEFLEKKWNQYFKSSFYYNVDTINGVPRDIYREFLTFLKKNFKQDILFDFLYDEYEKNVLKKHIKLYLNKTDFERHLLDFDLKTYVVMDDNYRFNKYVYFYSKIK